MEDIKSIIKDDGRVCSSCTGFWWRCAILSSWTLEPSIQSMKAMIKKKKKGCWYAGAMSQACALSSE